ncbi:MAG: AraC family transcriptional regulator [Pseudomonadota bacterium]
MSLDARHDPTAPAHLSGRLPHLQFSSDTFDDRDRLDALNAFSRGLYSYSPCEDDGSAPRLMLDAWALDDIAAASIAYGPTEVRAPDRLDAAFEDMLFLRFVRTGRIRIESGDAQQEFGPGSVFLMQAHHTLHALDDGTALSLRLPYGRLDYDPSRHAPVKGLSGHVWQVRVLVSAVKALFETLPGMAPADVPAVAAQLAGMVRAVIATETCDDEGWAALKSGRTAAMRRYIVANLSRSDLDASHLQSEFNASRATIYRAFDEVGGVAHFVREQRLAAIHRDLRSTPPVRGAIRRIAERHGLPDQSSFMRMFRARYGMRPGEVLGSAHRDLPREPLPADANHFGLPSLASFWANQP